MEGDPDPELLATLLAKTRSLPGVTRTASYAAFFAGPLAPDKKGDLSYVEGEAVGSIGGLYFDQDRFAPTSGRLPDPSRADEIAVGEQMAKAHGLRVGQRLAIGVWRPDADDTFFDTNPDPNDRLDVTVVGIGLFNDEIVQDEVDRTPRVLFTPAFTQREMAYMSYIWTGVQLRRGDADVAQFKRDYVGILPEESQVNSRVNSVITTQAQRAIRPLAVALGTFGALCAVATLLLVGQALARLVTAELEDLRILRAMGAGPGQTASMELPGAAVSIAGGALLAIAVAVALSPLTPIGPVRSVEAEPGASFDWTALALGGILIATALALVTVIVAFRQSPHRRAARPVDAHQRSTAVGAAAAAGLPVPAVAGIRLALEPGAGRTAAPVRAVAGGAVVALVASLVFGSSLRSLVREPRLYGWDWELTLLDNAGYGTISGPKAHELLDHDPDVAAWSGVFFGSVDLDGRTVPALGVDTDAAVSPPLLSGRHVRAPDEVVLGRNTLAELGKRVGDTVIVGSGDQRGQLRIVGAAALPTVGITRGAYTSLGVGAALPSDKVRSAGTQDSDSGTAVGNALFIRLGDGADRASTTDRVAAGGNEVGEYPGSATLVPPQRPAAIVNYADIRATPTLLAAGLSLAVLVSLGLALAAGVRRRRDLAVLKTLGFTRRQLSGDGELAGDHHCAYRLGRRGAPGCRGGPPALVGLRRPTVRRGPSHHSGGPDRCPGRGPRPPRQRRRRRTRSPCRPHPRGRPPAFGMIRVPLLRLCRHAPPPEEGPSRRSRDARSKGRMMSARLRLGEPDGYFLGDREQASIGGDQRGSLLLGHGHVRGVVRRQAPANPGRHGGQFGLHEGDGELVDRRPDLPELLGCPLPAAAEGVDYLEGQQVRSRQGQRAGSMFAPEGKRLLLAFHLGPEPLQDHRSIDDGAPHPQCASRASRSARMAVVESSSPLGLRANSSSRRSNAAWTLGDAPGPFASPRASAAMLLRYALRESSYPRAASSMRRSRASSMETSTLATARVYPDSRPTKAALVLRTE